MSVKGDTLSDFVDNEKAFDVTDLDQWVGKNNVDSNKITVLDDIYQATEKKI